MLLFDEEHVVACFGEPVRGSRPRGTGADYENVAGVLRWAWLVRRYLVEMGYVVSGHMVRLSATDEIPDMPSVREPW